MLEEEDVEALGMSEKSTEGKITWIGNKVHDNARQVAGIFGDVKVEYLGELKYQDNAADGHAKQALGPMSGAAMSDFFAD